MKKSGIYIAIFLVVSLLLLPPKVVSQERISQKNVKHGASQVYVLPSLSAPAKDLHIRKLTEIDLTKPLGPEQFCDAGTSRVVTSQVGAYREAGEKNFSRFAIRFRIEHPGAPHLFVVHYPDDKERCAEVSTYSPSHLDMFNAHTGYLTGGEFPVTMRMMRLPLLVFPRVSEQGLVFTTWEQGKPVAASKVEVYEVEGGLPAAISHSCEYSASMKKRPEENGSIPKRLIGLYFEDPMLSHCFGVTKGPSVFADFDHTACNLTIYMRYVGFNVLFYPLAWYTGPLYSSQVEDTKKATASNRHPPERFVEILMERLDAIDAKFFGSIWLHSLPSLRETAVDDESKVQQGADTPLCMNKDGQLIKKTFHHFPPMFNPIHPKVKQQVLRLVDEILERYGDHPAFAGISLHLATPSLLWWGSLDVDYGDHTVSLFERETGIKVLASPTEPQRFTKRHQWLMKHVREKWIDWRCRKIYENIMVIAERVKRKRGDLKLVLAVYTPVGYCDLTPDDASAWDKYGRSVREYNRIVNGLDIAMFKNKKDIILTRTLYPADYRYCKATGSCTPSQLNLSREINFDASVTKWFDKPGACGINLHNRYFESSFGREHPLKCLWWGPMNWRASAVLPADRNFLELFAYWLSELDPAILTTGGFSVGTIGREDVLREFAVIFKQLPTTDWRDLPSLVEPVRGREWVGSQSRLLYLVNHKPHTIALTLSFDQPVHLKSLSSIDQLDASGNNIMLSFEPFQLRAFELTPHQATLISAQAKQHRGDMSSRK